MHRVRVYIMSGQHVVSRGQSSAHSAHRTSQRSTCRGQWRYCKCLHTRPHDSSCQLAWKERTLIGAADIAQVPSRARPSGESIVPLSMAVSFILWCGWVVTGRTTPCEATRTIGCRPTSAGATRTGERLTQAAIWAVVLRELRFTCPVPYRPRGITHTTKDALFVPRHCLLRPEERARGIHDEHESVCVRESVCA